MEKSSAATVVSSGDSKNLHPIMTAKQNVRELLLFIAIQRVAKDGKAAIDKFQQLHGLGGVASAYAPDSSGG
jgi:hypothetical protein